MSTLTEAEANYKHPLMWVSLNVENEFLKVEEKVSSRFKKEWYYEFY